MKFYLSNGREIENLKKYITDYMKNNPEVDIYIGTDSQRKKRRKVSYVTTICFRHPGDGVHIINHREFGKFTKDLFSKLWKEVELTVQTIDLIKDYIDQNKLTIDLDLNSLKKWESNIAHDAAKGYITGLGYTVRTKPDGWAASRASNHLTKKKM